MYAGGVLLDWLRTKWRTLLLSATAAALLAVLSLLGIQKYIGWEVTATGSRAMQQFSGDRVEALVKLVDCEQCSLPQRNRAVWALGEMGNPRALAVLQRRHTGGKCDHAHALCQYELGKAIKKIQGTWGLLPYLARARRQ